MDTILEQCPGVIIKADAITVFGKDKQEHAKKLHILIQAAGKHGLVFNGDKCEIAVEKMSFFGNEYSKAGISPRPTKVKDLQDCPDPTTVSWVYPVPGALHTQSV